MLNKKEFDYISEKLKFCEDSEAFDKKSALNVLSFAIQNNTNIFELLNEDQSIEEMFKIAENYSYQNLQSMMLKEIVMLKQKIESLEKKNG